MPAQAVSAPTTDAGDTGAIPDLAQRNFTAEVPGTNVVGHVTYIRTDRGFAYLATVIDCRTKECIGYAIAGHMRADLVCDALEMAARNSEAPKIEVCQRALNSYPGSETLGRAAAADRRRSHQGTLP